MSAEVQTWKGVGAVHIERYEHGGGRVWREAEDGGRDLVLDLYSPAERREEILSRIAAAPELAELLRRFFVAHEELSEEPSRGGRTLGEILAEHGFFKDARALLAKLEAER